MNANFCRKIFDQQGFNALTLMGIKTRIKMKNATLASRVFLNVYMVHPA